MQTHLPIIESRQNSRIKQLRAAFAGNMKLSGGMAAIEGEHLLLEALRSGLPLQTVFLRAGRESILDRLKPPASTQLVILSGAVFDSSVATESPQGVAALVRLPVFERADLLGRANEAATAAPPLILAAAGLQDPGNLGTLIRSAEAFGASGVLTLHGTVSAWNQKALRSSAGSTFRVPLLADQTQDALLWLRSKGIRILAAVADHGLSVVDVDLCVPCALLIGNEGAGLSPEILAQADERVTIPCPGPVESLNAAVAGSLLLYEASRQRASKHKA